jgi:hypothetical protein
VVLSKKKVSLTLNLIIQKMRIKKESPSKVLNKKPQLLKKSFQQVKPNNNQLRLSN